MSEPATAAVRRFGAWSLLKYRFMQLRNAVDQQLRDAPLQTLAVVALLVLIWCALYVLLEQVLRHVRSWELVGTVAQDYIFINFFFILALMLSFSNAILAFGSLYGRTEAGHLMTMPVHARQVVLIKWIEGLLLSSWSFLLLGVPLMLAVAAQYRVDWYFYPVFTGHFIGFVVLPATAGVLVAWAVAMFAPRRPLALALWIGCGALTIMVAWMWRVAQTASEPDEWLRQLIDDLSFTRSPILPSAWTARGVIALIRGDLGDSMFYLAIVGGNAVFLIWLTVNLLGGTWETAFSRAQHGRTQSTIRRGWFTQAVCLLLFWYLPPKLRMIMLKDIRTFARDATQWTQMVIMMGLLLLYALNLKRLPLGVGQPTMRALVTFLNLTTVSLILATFTSRFVYPLLSLETQQLWLLGLLPIRRVTLLAVKFLFALTITGLSAVAVMGVAVSMLELPVLWMYVNIAVCLAICIGLCGLSVGLGARFPVLGQRNPARIGSGFGGTLNLVASMVFVGVEMFGMTVLSLREVKEANGMPTELTPEGWQLLIAMLLLGLLVAGGSLWVGARHFARLEH